MATFIYGDRVRLTVTFKRQGVLYDPKRITLAVEASPDHHRGREVFSYPGAIVRESTGLYYIESMADFLGTRKLRWRSTATGEEKSIDGTFTVTT